MGALVGAGKDLEYSARLEIIKSCRIALWDSLASSVRPGSLDANIDQATAQPNDFGRFLELHASIRLIAFNGQVSQKTFLRHIDRDPAITWPHIDQVLLPSTSAANAGMSLEDKTRAWSIITRYCELD